MNTVISEVDGLIAEMKALDKFNDDVFIQQPRDPRGQIFESLFEDVAAVVISTVNMACINPCCMR